MKNKSQSLQQKKKKMITNVEMITSKEQCDERQEKQEKQEIDIPECDRLCTFYYQGNISCIFRPTDIDHFSLSTYEKKENYYFVEIRGGHHSFYAYFDDEAQQKLVKILETQKKSY